MGEGTTNYGNPFAPPSADADFSMRDQLHYGHGFALASYGARLAGAIIDGLLILVVALPLPVLAMVYDERPGPDAVWIPMGLAFLAVLGLQAYQWYLVSTTGQTLAKRWLKMRIIRDNGEPVDFMTAVVVRVWAISLAQMIPYVGSLIGLADGLMIFAGENRQTLHDRLAHTLVVRTDGLAG